LKEIKERSLKAKKNPEKHRESLWNEAALEKGGKF